MKPIARTRTGQARWTTRLALVAAAATIAAPVPARAQRGPLGPRDPHIGYLYPAGACRGGTIDIVVGGQFLEDASGVEIAGGGGGISIEPGEHTAPLTQQQVNEFREKIEEARKRMQAEGRTPGRGGFAKFGKFGKSAGAGGEMAMFMEIAQEIGLTEKEIKALQAFRLSRFDPKRQINPAIAETVVLKVSLDPDAAPGARELRVRTPTGLSNPLTFHVGDLPEYAESEPNDREADPAIRGPLPAVVNGQILPGDVDRFAFQARKGQKLVIGARARALVPHMADAVPGWFQATLALFGPRGDEVAFNDDYQFDPDPVLCFEVPEDGAYVIEIRDAIYRGREDFVYRITLGELPFVTAIFPLGGPAGAPSVVKLTGWNLPAATLTVDPGRTGPGVIPVSVTRDGLTSNRVPFAVDTLPECIEKEPNDDATHVQPLAGTIVVNGRIDRPGDIDLFAVRGRPGEEMVAEVQARRLNSPLDSRLTIADMAGAQIAFNDDREDKASPLATHHADSRVEFRLPAGGACIVRIGDTQRKGGPEHAYRLRIAPRRPDYALRVVPSAINGRAGSSVPITVHALRQDGFTGDITLELVDAPPGFALSGALVPAGRDQARLTIGVPETHPAGPVNLILQGRAAIARREVIRPAVPADDMMQAFAYHHLVPAQRLVLDVADAARFRVPRFQLAGDGPVKLRAGAVTRFQVTASWTVPAGRILLELSDAPAGIAIEEVAPSREGLAVTLRVERDKVRPGDKGNLIVVAFYEPDPARAPARGGAAGRMRRLPVGTLPAIPFEVVGL